MRPNHAAAADLNPNPASNPRPKSNRISFPVKHLSSCNANSNPLGTTAEKARRSVWSRTARVATTAPGRLGDKADQTARLFKFGIAHVLGDMTA